MVDMFAQQRAPRREAERLKTLAESLQQGGQYKGNEMVSGRIVKQSPLEHLARGLQTAAGGYFSGQAENKINEDETALQQRMSEALSQWGNPQEAAAILAQDPRTAEMAFKLMQGETDFSREKELAQMRISALGGRGGNIPAPMQIANQMFELEQMMNNPNLPEEQRFLAERQYNLLGQAAKTYGFDRGLQAGAMGGYESVYGTPQMQPAGQDYQVPQSYMPVAQDMQGIPPVDMMPNGEMQAPMGGQSSSTASPMQSMGQDPMAAHAQAVAQQQQIGVSPMQRPELRGVGMQEVPGYGQAAASIAAQKKAAEERAGEIGKRQGENENLYRSMVSRMPQLEDTAERLSKLGQAATYTNAGQIRDFTLRELGREVPDSATARAEYISMVDNEILPLLRDTFGAQFTQKEGESLKATLGNPNVSPKEKDAVLRSFMRTKAQALESLGREINSGQSLPNYTPRDLNIGGQSYSPMGAKPQMGRENIIQTLRQNGASDEEINAYLQARGL